MNNTRNIAVGQEDSKGNLHCRVCKPTLEEGNRTFLLETFALSAQCDRCFRRLDLYHWGAALQAEGGPWGQIFAITSYGARTPIAYEQAEELMRKNPNGEG